MGFLRGSVSEHSVVLRLYRRASSGVFRVSGGLSGMGNVGRATSRSGGRCSFRSAARRRIAGIEIARPVYSMFTARAARIAMVASEMIACSIIRILAQRESTGTSVGEKAVLVLKARNR